MEENWVKIENIHLANISKFSKPQIEEIKEFWKNVLEDNKIEYKFEDGENYISKVRSGIFNKKEFLNLYVKEEDLKKAEELIKEVTDSKNVVKEKELEKDEYSDFSLPAPLIAFKYFLIISIFLAFAGEIYLLVDSILSGDFYMSMLLIFALIWLLQIASLKMLLKKKGH